MVYSDDLKGVGPLRHLNISSPISRTYCNVRDLSVRALAGILAVCLHMIYMGLKGNVVVMLIHLYRGYCIWFLKGAIYKTWPGNV